MGRADANSARAARVSPGALLFVVASACSVAPATLPLDSACRIEVQLTGQPLRMVVDTGAMATLFSVAAVERLGLPMRAAAATVTDSTGLERPAARVDFEDLWIGNMRYAGWAVCVPAPEHVGDGLLGMNVLSHVSWLFDVPGKVLHTAVHADAETMVASHGYHVVARLPLGSDPLRPMVTVRLEDQEDVTLLLDSGAGSTSLPAAVVTRLGLPAGEDLARRQAAVRQERFQAEMEEHNAKAIADGVKITVTVPPEDGRSTGVHGESKVYPLHHLRRLTLGGIPFDDLLVTAGEDEGLLGRDVLGTFPWLLHGERRELWLLRRP